MENSYQNRVIIDANWQSMEKMAAILISEKMGKAAREQNQKKMGKTDEKRRAATAKVTKDASAPFVCM
eukprot:scaffold82814_cov52-Attheya_sp.AAC.1